MDKLTKINRFFDKYINKVKLNDIDLFNIYCFLERNNKSKEELLAIANKMNSLGSIFVDTEYEHKIEGFLTNIAINMDIRECKMFENLQNIRYKLTIIIKVILKVIKDRSVVYSMDKLFMLQSNINYLYKLIGNEKEYYDLDDLFEDKYSINIFIYSLYQDLDGFKNIFSFYDKVVANTSFKNVYRLNTPKKYRMYYLFNIYKLKLIKE